VLADPLAAVSVLEPTPALALPTPTVALEVL
jgi:hypothetical protein